MSVPFFYLPPKEWGQEVCLEGQEARHLAQALRLEAGCEVGLLDGQGRVGRFLIRKVSKKNAWLTQVSEKFYPSPTSLAVMALAFSKAARRGFFMEKAAELGAHALWFWQGDHSQGKLPADAQASWQGQLIAGAKQCGNPWLPEVRRLSSGVVELAALAAEADYRLLPWEQQADVPMLTPDMAGRPGLTVYVIGPEGGFSDRELAVLGEAGFTPVSLGARVLRCETAATLCLGIHWWASQVPAKAINDSGK